ncbi:MAG TPA: tetratricopeptide repeat protein [Bacteroidales bacterium]
MLVQESALGLFWFLLIDALEEIKYGLNTTSEKRIEGPLLKRIIIAKFTISNQIITCYMKNQGPTGNSDYIKSISPDSMSFSELYVKCQIPKLINEATLIIDNDKLKNSRLYYEATYYLAKAYFWQGKYAKALEVANMYFTDSTKLPTPEFEVDVWILMGKIYYKLGQYEKSYDDYLLLALRKSEQINNNDLKALTLIEIAKYKNRARIIKEYLNITEEALLIAKNLSDQFVVADCYYASAVANQRYGSINRAIQLFNTAFSIYESVGDKRGIARVLRQQIYVFPKEDFSKKMENLGLSIKIAHEIDSQVELAHCYSAYGWQLLDDKKYFDAIQYFVKSLKISQSMGDLLAQSYSHTDIASAFFNQDNLDDSRKSYLKAINIVEGMNDYFSMAKINLEIGKTYFFQNEYQKAVEHFSTSGQQYIIPQKGSKADIADVAYWIGRSEAMLDNHEEAIGYFNAAILGYEEKQMLLELANAHLMAGTSNFNIDNFDEAENHYQKALFTTRQLEQVDYIASSLDKLAVIAFKKKQYHKAIKYLTEAIEIHDELNNKHNLSYDYRLLGDMYFLTEEYKNAVSYYKNALELAIDSNDLERAADLYMEIGDTYYEINKLKKALFNYKEAIKINQANPHFNMLTENYEFLADVYFDLEDYKEAINNYLPVVNFYKNELDEDLIDVSDNKRLDLLTYNLTQLALSFLNSNNKLAAIKYYIDLAGVYEKMGSYHDLALTQKKIGELYATATNDIDLALKYLDKARAYFVGININEPKIEAEIYEMMGLLNVKANRIEKAKMFFVMAESTYSNLKDAESHERIRKYQKELR